MQIEGGDVARHMAEESHEKGQPFLMPQTERELVAHRVLSRFLKAFINRVSAVVSSACFYSCSVSTFDTLDYRVYVRRARSSRSVNS